MKNKLIVRIAEGLGNQLFMYAHAYSLSKKINYDLYIDNTSGYFKKKNQELTPEQKQELDNIIEVIQTEADIVKMDYEQNPSNLDSGSVIVVHQNSTLLDDTKEELSDVAYNITRKSSSINEWGDDDWATPENEKNYNGE